MNKVSGKFVFRTSESEHKRLKNESRSLGVSLNQYINSLINGRSTQQSLEDELIEAITSKWSPIAIIKFGSSVRGEETSSSDIDLLIVLSSNQSISRELYKSWDQNIPSRFHTYSPQFVHLPNMKRIGGLWLEVALEGEILYWVGKHFKYEIFEIKNKIASGEYQRNWSYGQPYWIHKGALNNAK